MISVVKVWVKKTFPSVHAQHRRDRGLGIQCAKFWGCSSVGRAPALQAGGRQFEPDQLHQNKDKRGMKIPFLTK